jgi:hypothetical protein
MPYFGRGVVPYGAYGGGGGALVPYWNGNTGFTLNGQAFTPYGGYSTSPVRGPGTAMVPYQGPTGFTLNGGPQTVPGTGFTMNGNPYWGGLAAGGAGGAGGRGLVPPGPGGPRGPIPLGAVGGAAAAAGGGRFLSAGMGSAIPAWMGGEFLKDVFEHAASFDAIKSGLLAQGFTAAQVDEAERLSYSTQRSTVGTSAKGNIDLVSKLMAVVQDPEEAMGLMPQYAKLSVLLNASGHGGEGEDIMDAIRSGEFRGVLTKKNAATGQNEIDTEGLTKFINEMVATNILSHGQIGPRQILQFLRSAGSAGALINDQELFARTVALQMAMGSGRAGRSLQGFEQQFTAGRMSEATANLLIEMGIIHGGGSAKNNPFLKKAGMGQFLMLPNAMGSDAFEEAMNSPTAFTMHRLFPKLQEMLHKQFGKSYDQADDRTKLGMETAMATQIASRIPGGTELSEIIRNVLIIGRDIGAFGKAMNRDAYDIALNNNPLLRQEAFIASWQAFETALGNAAMVPAIHALEYLTGSLNHLTEWAQKNPEAAKLALEGLAGAVTALGTGAAISALTALGGPAGKLAAVGAGALILSGNIDVLGKAMNALPNWVIQAGLGAYIGGKIAGGPGAFAGAVGGGIWNANPFHLNEITPADAWHYLFGGGKAATGGNPTDLSNAPDFSALTGPEGRSFAPPAGSTGGGGGKGPVPVVITNPGDLTRGVASGIANQSNRPQSGYTGVDPTIDAANAWLGVQ